jgi:hypothetical protein
LILLNIGLETIIVQKSSFNRHSYIRRPRHQTHGNIVKRVIRKIVTGRPNNTKSGHAAEIGETLRPTFEFAQVNQQG